MIPHNTEQVIAVHHWNDKLFSFRTTRSTTLRFQNGHFLMLGLEVDGRPLVRAYSIASANYDEYLEFLSIKVQDGELTSRLQHLEAGDTVLVSRKSVGTLVVDDLLPGRNLYLLATGTGLAPFLSIIKDPSIYERFERVVLVHGVRRVRDLAYAEFIENELPNNEFFGEEVRARLIYVPTVTRETFRTRGRITHLIDSGTLAQITNLPQLNPESDRVMLCGSPAMLADLRAALDARGFVASPQKGHAGHYVIERAFAER
jgi:ferredoxin--NADP+ reductase